jgi:hypothetical protein
MRSGRRGRRLVDDGGGPVELASMFPFDSAHFRDSVVAPVGYPRWSRAYPRARRQAAANEPTVRMWFRNTQGARKACHCSALVAEARVFIQGYVSGEGHVPALIERSLRSD